MYFKKIATSQFKALLQKLNEPEPTSNTASLRNPLFKPTKRNIDENTLELPKLQWMKIRISYGPMKKLGGGFFRQPLLNRL